MEETLPTEALAGADVRLATPVQVRLEVQQAGGDVVVRGEIGGRVALECRRCLKALELPVQEPVSALFTEQVQAAEAEGEGVYPLPVHARMLELQELVREQLLLGAPQYALCDDACRGLCLHCGADLNQVECGCTIQDVDERWAPLRRLRRD
ncbi:MAG: YceD family protein [Longimicrobiales bacterium]